MMESIHMDVGEIFDEPTADDSDDGLTVHALPDLQLATDQIFGEDDNDQGEANVDVLARLQKLAKGAAKKVVKRPQPKLDSTRLTGSRGFPSLPKLFKDIKFKGQGHEAQDLDTVMKIYEHWAHRLFPKMTFDEVIERVERLGTKREIQTTVKKMRLGIPLLMGEDDGNEAEGTEGQLNEDDEPDREENALDAIFRAELPTNTPTSTPTSTTTPPTVMSESQKERMERNRRVAMEKRLARQASPYCATRQPVTGPSQQNTLNEDINVIDTPAIDKAADDTQNIDTG